MQAPILFIFSFFHIYFLLSLFHPPTTKLCIQEIAQNSKPWAKPELRKKNRCTDSSGHATPRVTPSARPSVFVRVRPGYPACRVWSDKQTAARAGVNKSNFFFLKLELWQLVAYAIAGMGRWESHAISVEQAGLFFFIFFLRLAWHWFSVGMHRTASTWELQITLMPCFFFFPRHNVGSTWYAKQSVYVIIAIGSHQ